MYSRCVLYCGVNFDLYLVCVYGGLRGGFMSGEEMKFGCFLCSVCWFCKDDLLGFVY